MKSNLVLFEVMLVKGRAMAVCTNPLFAAACFVIVAAVKWIHKSGSALPRRNSSTRWPSSPRKRGRRCSRWCGLAFSPQRWVSQRRLQQQQRPPCVPQAPAWALDGWNTERRLSGKEQWPHLPRSPTPHSQTSSRYCMRCKSTQTSCIKCSPSVSPLSSFNISLTYFVFYCLTWVSYLSIDIFILAQPL